MRHRTVVFSLLAVLLVDGVYSNTPMSTSSYLSAADKARLKSVIQPGLKLEDLSTVYHTVVGYKFLKESIPNVEDICKYLKTYVQENAVTPETAFYVASIKKITNTCPDLPTTAVIESATSTIDKDTSTPVDLYYAVNTLTALSQKLTDERIGKVIKTLQNALKKDDGLWNLGYTFHIASELGPAGLFAFDRVEDTIVQADEVNGQFLQFEGGLSVTSHIVNGIYKLCTSLKKKPPITSQQTVKLANYFLSRRSVQTSKGVVYLVSALDTLGNNAFEKPVCITIPDGGIIISEQQPLITIKVCDILGNPLTTVPKVVANSATRVGDDVVILSEEPLQPSTTDKTLFSLNLMKLKPERGFYKISVTAASVKNTVTVKVLSAVAVDYLEIGTGDADQTTQPKLTRVAFPEKLDQKVEADSQQKLVIRFVLKDAANKKPMRVHQAFVRLSSASASSPDKRGHEIIFVAEPDAALVYKFDMHLGSAASNFGHQSGDYNVELIVGDAVVSNPFQWTIATASLKFPDPPASEMIEKKAHRQRAEIYSTKPEIKHMFREPEKRPPAFVSNLFTGLCLAPILLLFILWFKLGVNISNFPVSLSAFIFHLGLGSIFVLFGIFWLRLNMFVTLRYLLGLGIVTFLAGNKLLSQIAQRHKLSR